MKGKKTVSVLLAVVLILAFLPMAVSASTAAVDKTVLVSAIESAETEAAVVVVGTDAADIDYGAQWVTEEVMTAFKDAITAAKTVNDNAGATETEVSGAAEVLETAAAVFDAAK